MKRVRKNTQMDLAQVGVIAFIAITAAILIGSLLSSALRLLFLDAVNPRSLGGNRNVSHSDSRMRLVDNRLPRSFQHALLESLIEQTEQTLPPMRAAGCLSDGAFRLIEILLVQMHEELRRRQEAMMHCPFQSAPTNDMTSPRQD